MDDKMDKVLDLLVPLENEYGIALRGLPFNDPRLIQIRKILYGDGKND